jgi:DNA polymerase III epsilon subunit
LHPADELADVRLQIKNLERREGELRTALIADREARVGAVLVAIVSERAKSVTDWQKLARGLGATAEQIKAHTTCSTYTVVETANVPSLPEVLRLLRGPMLMLDTETTGLSPAAGDRIVSLALAPARLERPFTYFGGERTFHEVVNPGRPSHPNALAVHGLTDEFLADKPPFSDHLDRVSDLLENATVVAQNAPFDMAFLKNEFALAGRALPPCTVVDTRVVSKMLWPAEKGSLDALCERLFIYRGERDLRHDALEDCRLLFEVVEALEGEISDRLEPGVPDTNLRVLQLEGGRA